MKAETIRKQSDFDLVSRELESYALGGVFLLCGSEMLYKKKMIKQIERLVFKDDESGKDMNYDSIYADDKEESSGFLSICRTGVFLGNYRMILLNEYDNKIKDDIIDYAERQTPTTVLVISSSLEADKDGLFKHFKSAKMKNVYLMNFPKAGEADAKGWVRQYLSNKGKRISSEALNFIIENIGYDISSLEAELSKVLSFHSDKEEIREDDLYDFVQNTSKEDKAFEFTDALLNGDGKKSLELFRMMKKSPMELHGLLTYKISNLYYLKLFPQPVNEFNAAKVIKANPHALKRDKKLLGRFTQQRLAYFISRLYELSIIFISQPKHVQLAEFEKFIFEITRNRS